ncbi:MULTISPECIES: hypothetical protein [Methylobacterium]|uniref:3',5'-cyclic-nucleotide phosphodiesterase n=1 Tax=Methylobacterium bullatum TaxID=570505 RepID=A0A679IRA9_9HYPH|nr:MULTISPECIES: hypothetical protein [Methylobacterium]KQO52461.1 hypothetical protein ASF08_20290 [Methylobacterium sp. Leaf85]KQP39112.1 hypothetical protein ASF34_15050 [Methylobacterium sp. Leaf106]MBD8900865.1 hypothetical protein [Methylobacterium bullatum]MCC0808335.1 hypothetical protein [Methylobacterium sp. W2]TXN26064.1 hypothetical protein FV220_16510 [Methylobacterium sp. WL19]
MRVATTRSSSPSKGRSLALKAAPFALLLLAAGPAQAQREDQGLQLGCANDYFRLCAGVDPNSNEAEKCMERNRPRLSAECRNAIGDYDRRSGGKSR